MAQLQLSTRQYVNLLEDSVIAVLQQYDISAHRDPDHPGVWIGHEKICALGVRIKSRVSMHGLALNVNNDLSLFGKIIPCGIKFRGVTSVERQIGENVDMNLLQERLTSKIISQLIAQPYVN
jgi:lipoate-protein ligase B